MQNITRFQLLASSTHTNHNTLQYCLFTSQPHFLPLLTRHSSPTTSDSPFHPPWTSSIDCHCKQNHSLKLHRYTFICKQLHHLLLYNTAVQVQPSKHFKHSLQTSIYTSATDQKKSSRPFSTSNHNFIQHHTIQICLYPSVTPLIVQPHCPL